MKKIITLLVFVVCTTMLYAQDIIITKDSKRIEAKIIEVTPTTVKYKKYIRVQRLNCVGINYERKDHLSAFSPPVYTGRHSVCGNRKASAYCLLGYKYSISDIMLQSR